MMSTARATTFRIEQSPVRHASSTCFDGSLSKSSPIIVSQVLPDDRAIRRRMSRPLVVAGVVAVAFGGILHIPIRRRH
jgi:hypothetical protein